MVVFGVDSSPFLHNAVLHDHLEICKEVDLNFASKLIESFDVEDLLTGSKKNGKLLLFIRKQAND